MKTTYKRLVFLGTVFVALFLVSFSHVLAVSSFILSDENAEVIIFSYYTAKDDFQGTCATIRKDGTDFHIIAEGDKKILYRRFTPDIPECSPGYYNSLLSPDQSKWLQYADYDWLAGVLDDDVLDGNKLEVRQLDGTHPTTLLSSLFPAIFFPYQLPSWMPDSRSVLYWKNQDADYRQFESEGEFVGDLIKIDADSGQVTMLATFKEGFNRPIWNIVPEGYVMALSPDGSVVLFYVQESREAPRDLYAVHTDGSGVINLTNTPNANEGGAFDNNLILSAAWSPDSQRVALLNYQPGVATITVNSANARSDPRKNAGVVNTFIQGTQLDILARENGFIKVLNEQGQEVWVSTSVLDIQGGGSEIDVINADGSGRTTVGPSTEFPSPAWSPDGRYLAFDCGGLCVVDATSFKTIAQTPGSGAYSWSPDSTKLAFINPNLQDQHLGEVHVYDLSKKQNMVVATFPVESFLTLSAVPWSSDGQFLLNGEYVCSMSDCLNLKDVVREIIGGSEELFLEGTRWLPERSITYPQS